MVSHCVYTEHSRRFPLCLSVLLQTLTLMCLCMPLFLPIASLCVYYMFIVFFYYRSSSIRWCDFMCNHYTAFVIKLLVCVLLVLLNYETCETYYMFMLLFLRKFCHCMSVCVCHFEQTVCNKHVRLLSVGFGVVTLCVIITQPLSLNCWYMF